MTFPAVNVIALGGVMGVGVIPTTHGLGGVSAQFVTTAPMATGGGRSTLETWWYKSPWDEAGDEDERQLLFELGIPPTVYRPTVTFADFEERVLAHLQEEAKTNNSAAFALEWMAAQDRLAAARQSQVKTAVTIAAGVYVTWKILSGLGFL